MSSETEGDDDDMGGDDSEGAVGDKDDDVDGDDDLRLSNAEIGTGDEEEKEGGHDSGEEDELKRHLQLPEGRGTEQDAEGEGAVGTILSLSVKSANEDVEKGKAAKQQISMWDAMLEGRIRMQKVLLLANRLPQLKSMADFREVGGERLAQALTQNQAMLTQTLDSLLDLQATLLAKVPGGGVGRCPPPQPSSSEDLEEIPSDSEAGDCPDVAPEVGGGSDDATATKQQRKRKRTRDWVLPAGQRQYEEHIARVYDSLKSYRNDVIAKWNSKTRLISGKLTNKAFINVDQSVLTQIQNVLNDTTRLVKRTQLKRFTSSVLGKRQRVEGTGEEVGDAPKKMPDGAYDDLSGDPSGERDAHLRDCDEEIFDDEDFYHRLLKDLIERKMNFTETSDPIAMGRQWLELQKLRTKAKKKVDTKASKGRKIRYQVHPKLVNFMAPIQRGSMSDASRNDLFYSLFGGSEKAAR
eukprot:Em0017g363a